jgi:hypothetical protein
MIGDDARIISILCACLDLCIADVYPGLKHNYVDDWCVRLFTLLDYSLTYINQMNSIGSTEAVVEEVLNIR